ncbi:hypothetical protein C8Q80DRAFT_519351 [Daedaleopsis nitida]|nr:hypothetical protein C8Q80DRAFT_519351 [Daedaleopsis nitida]
MYHSFLCVVMTFVKSKELPAECYAISGHRNRCHIHPALLRSSRQVAYRVGVHGRGADFNAPALRERVRHASAHLERTWGEEDSGRVLTSHSCLCRSASSVHAQLCGPRCMPAGTHRARTSCMPRTRESTWGIVIDSLGSGVWQRSCPPPGLPTFNLSINARLAGILFVSQGITLSPFGRGEDALEEAYGTRCALCEKLASVKTEMHMELAQDARLLCAAAQTDTFTGIKGPCVAEQEACS